MSKWLKTAIAVLLLPVCLGAGRALWLVLRASSSAESFWVAAGAGAACWTVIYLLLPKPMLAYVFGHELTHVFWTWLFGGKVKKFRASGAGGHVVVSKTNFLIALAPYFFPLYVVLIVAAFWLTNLIWNCRSLFVWFHLLVGAAYAFHATLTWHILKTNQSDISRQGYFFSAVVIFLGNVIVLLVCIPLLLPKVSILSALGWWLESTGEVLHRVARLF